MTEEQKKQIIKEAETWLKTAYAQSPSVGAKGVSVDCSHFIWHVFKKVLNPDLSYQTTEQISSNGFMYDETLSPTLGDVVWWPGHVGIVTDPSSGQFIGSQSSTGVAYSNYLNNPYWRKRDGMKFFRLRTSYIHQQGLIKQGVAHE